MKRFLRSEPLLSADGRKMSEGIDFLIRVHVLQWRWIWGDVCSETLWLLDLKAGEVCSAFSSVLEAAAMLMRRPCAV